MKMLAFRVFRLQIWECDFERQKAANPEMKAFIEEVNIVEPLNPRGCFYGGRVNPLVLYKAVGGSETIEYADYVSLYPTVLKVRTVLFACNRV